MSLENANEFYSRSMRFLSYDIVWIDSWASLFVCVGSQETVPLYNISYIATYLLETKDDPKAFHYPYVRTIFELPGGKKWYPSYMPVFMNAEELAQLENTFAIEDMNDFNNSAKKEFDGFSKVCWSWSRVHLSRPTFVLSPSLKYKIRLLRQFPNFSGLVFRKSNLIFKKEKLQ